MICKYNILLGLIDKFDLENFWIPGTPNLTLSIYIFDRLMKYYFII